MRRDRITLRPAVAPMQLIPGIDPKWSMASVRYQGAQPIRKCSHQV